MLEGLAGNKLKTLAMACLETCIQAQKELVEHGTPADKFLAEFYRNNHKYGSRDRRAISGCVFAYFRWRGCLEKIFDLSGEEGLTGPALSAALAADDPTCPVFPFWSNVAPDALVAIKDPFERILAVTNADVDLDYFDLVPDWMPEEVPESSREAWLHGLASRPSVWLRAQKISSADLIRRLAAQGIHAERGSEVLVNAVRVKGTVHLDQLTGLAGLCEVQDYSSQCIAWPAEPAPKEHWWDCCCGAGGKTLQLAAEGGRKVQIFASDIRQDVLEQLKKRAAAAKFKNIIVTTPLAASLEEFDGVLVDAPCSSSGRWRRNPEMRWVFRKEDLTALTKKQFSILDKAANSVRPGGRLIYGTCSVFDVENMGVVKRFLSARPDFKLKPFPNPNGSGKTDGTLATLSDQADCDCSFTALFQRNGGK